MACRLIIHDKIDVVPFGLAPNCGYLAGEICIVDRTSIGGANIPTPNTNNKNLKNDPSNISYIAFYCQAHDKIYFNYMFFVSLVKIIDMIRHRQVRGGVMNRIFCRLGFTAAMVMNLSVTATPALAWDGAVIGKVAQIDMSEIGTNFGFRVKLENNPLLCKGGSDWAYINSTSTNYQAIASALMLAYSSGKPVTLYTNRYARNYCKLGYVVLRPSP